MKTAVIFDCEFLAIEGSQRRFWCGPFDPDPVAVQIGAVRIGLTEGYPLGETLSVLIRPADRHGRPVQIDPFFTDLTGITGADLETRGVGLAEALATLDRFAQGARLFSWGKDEFHLIAISCYVAGIDPPIPATRFGNACDLALAAGMPYAAIEQTRSNRLPAYFDLETPSLRAHDATDDARAVAIAMRHLLMTGALSPDLLV